LPYYDSQGMRVPDVLDDADGPGGAVSGLDRYRAVLAHMVGHRRWTVPQIADNWSPFQRMAVEFFEDCRVELLLMRDYPGLRRDLPRAPSAARKPGCLRSGKPRPACAIASPCSRGRCSTPGHGYADPDLVEFVARFHGLLAGAGRLEHRPGGRSWRSPGWRGRGARATSSRGCISPTR
jgi:nitric oxide reductase NorD protein